jgi:hypothetical protein
VHQRLILFMYKACIVFMLSDFFICFLAARDPTTTVSIVHAHAPAGDEYGEDLYRHVCRPFCIASCDC